MDIEFGKLNEATPQSGLRPDQDGQWSVVRVGELLSGELPIYVDLDVMRDMEAHASSNTRVELGGVVLGYQRVDDDGNPFVVVTDCLRAEHYHATKGSFTFTHETWSQITRDRAKFKPELEMIGWYHTHPGWSVFLSGMDLFICENFFNRPLDVALVIDPCNDDRGWFEWMSSDKIKEIESDDQEIAEPSRTTRRTGGFYLIANRFRQRELEHFAHQYSRESDMNRDPRSIAQPAGVSQPMVHLIDNRRPLFELAVGSMLLTQLLLLLMIGWRMTGPQTGAVEPDEMSKLRSQLTELQQERTAELRSDAHEEILQAIVGQQTGESDLVSRFKSVKESHEQLESNLKAQQALVEKLESDRDQVSKEAERQKWVSQRSAEQLDQAKAELQDAKRQIEALKASHAISESPRTSEEPAIEADTLLGRLTIDKVPFWGAVSGGILLLGLGVLLGVVVDRYAGRRLNLDRKVPPI